MNYLLDSSALFAHFFNEPGADEVRVIFHEPKAHISICVITILELFAMLKLRGQAEQFETVLAQYRQLLDTVRTVDETVVQQAVELRRQIEQRLPNADALIAATAILEGAILVHRDNHFRTIPETLLKQMPLPVMNEPPDREDSLPDKK